MEGAMKCEKSAETEVDMEKLRWERNDAGSEGKREKGLKEKK